MSTARFLTRAEAAAFAHITVSTVDRWIRNETIVSTVIGGRRLIDAAGLDLIAQANSTGPDVAGLVRRSTAASGVPERIDDAAAAEQIAGLLQQAERDRLRARRRGSERLNAT